MLKEAGVAITPGLDFDIKRGHTKVRFSYARSTLEITEGLRRIDQFMKSLGKR